MGSLRNGKSIIQILCLVYGAGFALLVGRCCTFIINSSQSLVLEHLAQHKRLEKQLLLSSRCLLYWKIPSDTSFTRALGWVIMLSMLDVSFVCEKVIWNETGVRIQSVRAPCLTDFYIFSILNICSFHTKLADL